MKIKNNKSWLNFKKKPIIISGPCSAENEKQMINTAYELEKIDNVDIFRAGIWKPRTKPNNFEGIGKVGLKWLQNIKQNTRLMVATEVANSYHVKLCLDHEIDILWIGARTTASPFAIQEIADALAGNKKIIVLIKNPIHPDIDLWIGAVERLYKKGIKKLGLIHRGFYTYNSKIYRNPPGWEFIINIKKILPDLPLFCDPSHICGNTEGILEISNIAYNILDFDGLMIESHCNPIKALSDSQQQITPKELLLTLNKIFNYSSCDDKQLHTIRVFIDELDENIISILSERIKLSKQLGYIKKLLNIPILQEKRWNNILNRVMLFGNKLGISDKFIQEIFKVLHKESIKIQNQVRK